MGVLVAVACRACGEGAPASSVDGSTGGPDGSGGDTGPIPVSCTSLPATCGANGTQPCCESSVVTGGTFYRGYDVATDGAYPDMSRPATLSDFRLDKYEVTVARFRQFVMADQGTQASPPAAGAGEHPGLANSGWNVEWNSLLPTDTAALVAALKCDATWGTWTDAPGAHESRPITCVSWYEAMAFCAWDGGRLPTDAQSSYAASGGNEQRAFPWSSPAASTAIDCGVANLGGASWPSSGCVGSGANNVGSTPDGDGRWGHSDLAGNVWEWALDWYATPYPTPCTDCANLFPATYRVVRGGSFIEPAADLRIGHRNSVIPTVRFFNVGFRCERPI